MTAIVLLAAGESRRMGQPKQLLDFKGVPLLRHVALTALAVGPVIVVLGALADSLRFALDGIPVEIVVNEQWEAGMGASIQTGLRLLEGRGDVTGAILALADQPFVTAEFFARLIAEHVRSGKGIVAASYAGTVGVPAYFSRAAFPHLMALPAGQGCKGVILAQVDDRVLFECPEAELDLDTPEDYRAALQA